MIDYRVLSIRLRKILVPPEYVLEFDKIGFVWNVEKYNFSLLSDAVKLYLAAVRKQRERDIDGKLSCLPLPSESNTRIRIPETFVVPAKPPWPLQLQGIQLGAKIYTLGMQYRRIKKNVHVLSSNQKSEMCDVNINSTNATNYISKKARKVMERVQYLRSLDLEI